PHRLFALIHARGTPLPRKGHAPLLSRASFYITISPRKTRGSPLFGRTLKLGCQSFCAVGQGRIGLVAPRSPVARETFRAFDRGYPGCVFDRLHGGEGLDRDPARYPA